MCCCLDGCGGSCCGVSSSTGAPPSITWKLIAGRLLLLGTDAGLGLAAPLVKLGAGSGIWAICRARSVRLRVVVGFEEGVEGREVGGPGLFSGELLLSLSLALLSRKEAKDSGLMSNLLKASLMLGCLSFGKVLGDEGGVGCLKRMLWCCGTGWEEAPSRPSVSASSSSLDWGLAASERSGEEESEACGVPGAGSESRGGVTGVAILLMSAAAKRVKASACSSGSSVPPWSAGSSDGERAKPQEELSVGSVSRSVPVKVCACVSEAGSGESWISLPDEGGVLVA